MNNYYYSMMTKSQVANVYRNQKKIIAKYLGMWTDAGHLSKFLVTLSPTENSIDSVIELRKDFLKKIKAVAHYKNEQIYYFSSIELGMNKTPISDKSEEFEMDRAIYDKFNNHIHLQLITTLTKEDIQKVMNKLSSIKCIFKTLSVPKVENIQYDYIIKDIKTINWELQYHIKKECKGKTLYTCSHKSIQNFLITKIWNYFKNRYPVQWKDIKNRYKFLLDLKESNDVIFGILDNKNNVKKEDYDRIIVKNKTVDIKRELF